MPRGFAGLGPGFAGFGFRGASLELLAIELAYFLAVIALCLIIYKKTNTIYQISQHKGLYYFRNIFLFFSLAYLFRLIHIIFVLSQELFFPGLPLRLFFPFTFFFVGFFGTMAILSLSMAALIKTTKLVEDKKAPYMLYIIALALSLAVALTRSNPALMVLQAVLLATAILVVFLKPGEKKTKKLLSQNRLTFLLLAVFWIVNLLAFTRHLAPFHVKIPLYVLSISVFASIFLRVEKRLPSHDKKKRQA